MTLPSTYGSALLLLLLSFVCLGSWINTFKLTGARWRFELYWIDFAIGALIVAVVAAFTFGSLGSDLPFGDRMLVAGHTAQAFLVASGFIFNLGGMMLMAGVSLLGMSIAFPLSGALAVFVSACFLFRSSNPFLLSGGMVLLLAAAIAEAVAARSRADWLNRAAQSKATVAEPSYARSADGGGTQTATLRRAAPPAVKTKMRRSTRGILLAVLGGISLGFFYPVGSTYLNGDFGLGPYAGFVMFSIGILLSTVLYNVYFLNIAIDGPRLGWRAYFRGKARQHLLGLGGGALWGGGILAAAVARTVPASSGVSPRLAFTLPLASVLLVVLWGTLAWREFSETTSKGRLLVYFGPALFLIGVTLIGTAFE